MAQLSRRTILKSTAALGLGATLPFGFVGTAHAARGRFVARIERDIQNLDPANRVSTVEDNVLACTNQRLAYFKRDSYDWELDAAETLTQVSPTQIDFKLKPGLAFTGGYGELTAEDVKFSFERFNQPGPGGKKAAYAADWGALDRVEVKDKLSGSIILKNPAPALWSTALCDGSGSIVSKKAFEALGEKVATQAVGSGPYMMAEWVPNQRVVLKANPDWKGPKPAFNEIVLRPVQDSKTAEVAFSAGELDFMRVELASVDGVAKVSGTTMKKLEGIDYIWIGMNVEKKPLDDVRVRKAIRLAIDVDAVLAAAYDGKVGRAKTLIPPALLGHWKDAPVYKQNVAEAKKLLAEAGQSNLKTRITVLNQSVYRNAALVVQANLAEAGIDCQVDAQDAGSYWSAGGGDSGKTLDLSLQLFKGKADPSFFTQWFVTDQIGKWNWQRWANPEFDAMHAKAGSTLDEKERVAALTRAQQLMDESSAYIWLTHDVLMLASKTWLKPATLPNGTNWQLAKFEEV